MLLMKSAGKKWLCGESFSLLRTCGFLFFLAAGTLFVMLVFTTAHFTSRQGLRDLAGEGKARLELYVSYLQGVLEKYEGLPELLATNKRLVNFMKKPGGRDRIEALNRYLATINDISDAADTYLMDREGLTIAASNWDAERPFIGRNFSYRPYFKQAMQGELGRYFALGTTSSRRGYYFAYPVRSNGEILGAVVIKINIDKVEHNWGHRDETFLVTDPDGVIFLSTNPAWRFQALRPLSPAVKERIEQSRRYPKSRLTPVPVLATNSTDTGSLLTLLENGREKEYLQQSRTMPQAGWKVHILSDTKHVRLLVRRTLIGTAAAFILVVVLVLMYRQQRLRLQEQGRHEEERRRMLEQVNLDLERRVSERTRALSEVNSQLRLEIGDRRRAEEKLRHARKELIHTAKLAAIGQMATGINHELNQPLAAIRAYGANGRELLLKGRVEEAISNFDRIAELTERMAGIGTQLKIFSRKSRGNLSSLPLQGVIDGALEILMPMLGKTGINIDINLDPPDISVWANSLLLQQALVNLITNGVHSVQKQEKPIVGVTGRFFENMVRIEVMDNGPGVGVADKEVIFDPFYTTKPSGQGLGLGLTITRRIIEEMDGHIYLEEKGSFTTFVMLLHRKSAEYSGKHGNVGIVS